MKFTRDGNGWECAVENTGYLEIETGDDSHTLSPQTKLTFYCDEPHEGIETFVELLSLHVFGLPVFTHLSTSDKTLLEQWCRGVADHHFLTTGD